MDSKCFLTSTDLQTRRARCQHQLSFLLLLACAKSHMLSASRRQLHLLRVSVVDRRQTWSMDKSWRCVTLSGFLHSQIVRCRLNPVSCGTHYSGPGLSENDSAVTTRLVDKSSQSESKSKSKSSPLKSKSKSKSGIQCPNQCFW